MTAFVRTDSGLSNYAKFYGVDYIVYTEGSESYSVSDVESGSYSTESVDIRFWSKVFRKFDLKKRVQFRAVGSRTVLDDISQKIDAGKVSKTIVAKDRDLDPLLGITYKSPFIIQTFGYSWENDIWNPELVKKLVDEAHLSGEIPKALCADIEEAFSNFYKDSLRFILLEISLRKRNDAVIPKCSGDQLINCKDSPPTFNRQRAAKLIREKRTKGIYGKKLGLKSVNCTPQRDCYGKLMQAFSYRLLCWAQKKEKIPGSTTIDSATAQLLTIFSSVPLSELESQLVAHYKNSMSKLARSLV